MRFFRRLNRALMVYGTLSMWFEDASEDGVLSAEEIGEGVTMLVDQMGYGDRIKVEPYVAEEA